MNQPNGPFVFNVQGTIFVSPNVQRPPTPTELQHLDVVFSDPLLPTDALHLRYATNRFPYLAFTMPHTGFRSTILRPLNYTKDAMPVIMLGGRYCLPQPVAASWLELELNLRTMAAKLFARYCPLMPAYWEMFPFPSDYRYDQGRHTEDSMRRAAIRARKAFVPLMAMCSYAIAMSPKFNEPAPDWANYLATSGAHPRWLEELRRTPIVNFSSGRVGCVLRHDPACLFLERIPKFVEANVPVWLVWNNPSDYAGTHCEAYRPSTEAVAAAMISRHPGPRVALAPVPHPLRHLYLTGSSNARENTSTKPHDTFPANTRPDDDSPQLSALHDGHHTIDGADDRPPAPEPHSGQLEGESLDAFMNRRAALNEDRAKRETPLQRAYREQKVAHASTYPLPGRHGARVFEWEPEGKWWLRKAMPRGYVEEQWELIPRGHLRYDSFRDEWDFCELFDPSAELPLDEDHDDLLHDYFHGQDSWTPAMHETPLTRRVIDGAAPCDCPFGTTNLDADPVPQSSGAITQPESMDIVLCSRYGFCGPPGPPMPDAASWHFTRKTLSDVVSPWLWPEYQGQVNTFVRAAIVDNVPPHLWDLDPASQSPIMFFNTDIVVERVTNGPQIFYRIVPRRAPSSNDALWDLIVPDPITAVECIRRSHSSIGKAGLVQFFIETGRPFSTRMPIHPQPLTSTARRRGYLMPVPGERHHKYVPDALDFKGYERDRSAFLLSHRASAAIKEGGIVWRLAIEHLRFDELIAGPVDLPLAMYQCFDGESIGGWDDQLRDDELDLMCGVYRIFTSALPIPSMYTNRTANDNLQAREPSKRQMRLGGQRVLHGKTAACMWATGRPRAKNGSSAGCRAYEQEQRVLNLHPDGRTPSSCTSRPVRL